MLSAFCSKKGLVGVAKVDPPLKVRVAGPGWSLLASLGGKNERRSRRQKKKKKKKKKTTSARHIVFWEVTSDLSGRGKKIVTKRLK